MARRIASASIAAVFTAALLVSSLAPGPAATAAEVPVRLSLMTFNVEYGGTVIDFAKIVEAVVKADADIVGINEGYAHVRKIARQAGYDHWNNRLDLISRYPIIDPPGADGRYVFVELSPGRVVAVANVHLSSSNYGPRRILDGWSRRKVLRTERRVRLPDLRPFVRALEPVAAGGIPSFVMGDMNSPSHVDYTAATVGQRPQILWPVAWPVTRLLERRGFIDSWHAVHPDPTVDEGLTWPAARPKSPDSWNPRKDAPHDRIDQIWATGDTATSLASVVVGERGGSGVSISVKPWGSDHRAVRSSFDVIPGALPVLAAAAPRLVDAGDDVTVIYHAPGATGERLVIVPTGGDPGTDAVDAQATPAGSPVDGSVVFPTGALAPGAYEAVLVDAADASLSRGPFWVRTPGAAPVLSTTKWAFDVGEPIGVTWTFAPGNRFDWIGVYERHADPWVAYYKGYIYTKASQEGSGVLGRRVIPGWPLPAGRYTVYYLLTDNYRQTASADFVIRG
jgi:endonuclease/exonuclease/phosphatase family metal-dependent hydrolase